MNFDDKEMQEKKLKLKRAWEKLHPPTNNKPFTGFDEDIIREKLETQRLVLEMTMKKDDLLF